MSLPSDTNGILCRGDLLRAGYSPKRITRDVRAGRLVRLRRDRYAAPGDRDVDRAVAAGGRLACVSLLAALGVFVWDARRVHLQVDPRSSRIRPEDGDIVHWVACRFGGGGLGAVSAEDALAQAVTCQAPRAAVATVDSVLQQRLLDRDAVEDVFAVLPARYGALLRLADASAESGSETFLRLILRRLGLRYDTQIWIDGVGRVDFLVEGWLIVECDSRAHHEGWDKQRNDRRRDLAAAAAGYVTLRPLAEDLFHRPEAVVAALRGILRGRPRR